MCVYSIVMCNVYCVHADAHTDGGLQPNDGSGNENVAAERGEGEEGENPRRSSSMDCLSDPNLWPRSLSSTNQVRATYMCTCTCIQVQTTIVYIGGM